MKTLRTLIKLHKKQIDDLITEINDFDQQKDTLEQNLQNLLEQVNKEIAEFAAGDYAFMLDKFLTSSKHNEKKIKDKISKLIEHLESLREELYAQFSELKKYEIALQNRLLEEQEALKKYEMKILDEYNTNKFTSNMNEK